MVKAKKENKTQELMEVLSKIKTLKKRESELKAEITEDYFEGNKIDEFDGKTFTITVSKTLSIQGEDKKERDKNAETLKNILKEKQMFDYLEPNVTSMGEVIKDFKDLIFYKTSKKVMNIKVPKDKDIVDDTINIDVL